VAARKPNCRRAVVDTIRYVVHNGCVWRAVPAGFPPWRTVYGLFQRWHMTGATWALHDALRAAARVAAGRAAEPTAAIIDSQSVRGAPTVAKASQGWDNANHAGWAVMPGWLSEAGLTQVSGVSVVDYPV
jgi:transposase